MEYDDLLPPDSGPVETAWVSTAEFIWPWIQLVEEALAIRLNGALATIEVFELAGAVMRDPVFLMKTLDSPSVYARDDLRVAGEMSKKEKLELRARLKAQRFL